MPPYRPIGERRIDVASVLAVLIGIAIVALLAGIGLGWVIWQILTLLGVP